MARFIHAVAVKPTATCAICGKKIVAGESYTVALPRGAAWHDDCSRQAQIEATDR